MFFGLLLFALFAPIPRGTARTQLCAHQGQCSSHPSCMARIQLAPIQGQCDSYPKLYGPSHLCIPDESHILGRWAWQPSV